VNSSSASFGLSSPSHFLRWFSYLDNYRTTVELFLVRSPDTPDGGESNETVTSGTTTMVRPGLDDPSVGAVD
jgi:hypothetical protein